MRTATRRGFVAGAAASAVAPSVAHGQTAATVVPRARRKTIRRGRAIAVTPHGNRLVIAHDRLRTIEVRGPGAVSRIVDVGGQPLAVAISPSGRLAAVTTAFWDQPGLAIVDLRTTKVLRRLDVGPAPSDVVFAAGGHRLVVVGGEQDGTVRIIETTTFKTLARNTLGPVPRGISLDAAGKRVWVAINGDARVIALDLTTGNRHRTIITPQLPDDVAVSPNGKRLLVSHGGRDADHVTEIVIRSGRRIRHAVGRLPSAVAWTPAGRGLVAVGGTGHVVVLGPKPRRVRVGGSPRGLAVAGHRVWTADVLSNAVNRVHV